MDKKSKQLVIVSAILGIIVIILLTTMALAKYVIKDEKDIEVTLRNVRISENEIEIIPSSWTNENVTVSISTKKNGEVYYKINENGEWKKYEKNFEVEENCNIYAKIKYTDGESPETVKEVTNIDKIKPTVEIQDKSEYTTSNIVTKLDGIENTNNGHSTSTTTWNDISGNKKNGTITDGTWGENYLQFNGTTTWANLGVMNSNYQTLEATFSADRDNIAEDVILSNWENGGAGIYLANGRLYASFYIGGEYKVIPSKEKCVIGEIYNAIGTYDGKKLSFYVNGVLQGELSITGKIGTPANSTVMAIGVNPSRNGKGGSTLFKGKIYNVAIYNQALTAEQVRSNAQNSLAQATGKYTILAGETTINISKKLIAKDEGGSGLKTLSYAYSQSNTTEPTTYEEFKNEATVKKSATGGNWYIWTKVLDNAGNRAEETKISPAYNVGYQISYDANGGTGAPKEQRKVHGTELKISEIIPTRTGYEFQGWATANTATTAELKEGENYTTDKAITLYAVWKKYKYLNTTTSKYYMKLSDALNEVKDKETIKAMDYAIETTAPTLAAAKAITFDLNGQTIVMSNVTLTNNGTLTITGASGTLTGSGADTITNNGTFVKNTETEIASSATADYYVIKNNGTATIGAGKLNGSFRIIRNNGNGILNITGGNFTSKNGIGILNYDNGNISISGGVIEGKEDTIGSIGSGGNIKISGGSITASEKAGVSICAGTTANITGGNITGRLYGIWSNSNINITIGKNDGNVSIESPKISSNYYGIFMQSGKINFYDGAITGASGKSIGGTAEKTVEETATNCVVVKTTSGSTETAVLGPSAPAVTAKLNNSSGANYTAGTWTGQNIWVQLKSASIGAGIKEYQWYKNGAWTSSEITTASNTGTILFTATRNETIRFRAIDNNGVVSAETVFGVKIDKTVPTVTINRTSANTFDWKASDTLSGVAGYAVTTLGSTPTSWTTNGTLTSGTKTISAAGTYYVWIKDKAGNVNKATINAYTVTYDYNGTKNYIVPLSNTIKCTGFSGALNTCFSLGTINKDDLKVGDQLTVSFTASYSGLTGVSGQTVSVIGQGSGNVTAWNPQFPTKENGADRNVHWTGTANNVTYTYRTRALTSSDLTNDSWNFMIRTDYYSAGTITISNVKVTRTTRETKTLLHGATLGTLPAPTERGYTLDGWYTAVTGGTKIATTTTATANATYYAHWAQKGYTITLATNGGTYNGATANSIFAATYGNDVNIGYPVKAGYTFNGWKDSTGKIYDRNLLKNAEAPKEFVDGSKSTNALGGWRTASVSGGTRSVVGYQDPPLPGIRKGFKITASGTATSLDVCQDQVPVTVGKYYTISVWAKGSGGLWLQAGNSSYTGKLFSMSNVTSWTKYSWTFKAGTDGSANNNMTNIYFGNHGATGTIDICGMKLEEGTGFKSTLWANTAANTTLTAQWTANNYTIKIDPNGGKFNNSTSVATYTKTFGSTVAATAPTKTGYTFGGWVPVKTEAGATWAEVLYHNNQGGTTLFANETEVKSVNMAQKYSILGQLETFRANTSSQFEFLLKYDEFGTQYNRWKQTSNPTSGTTISGYSAVSNSWTGDSWGGIAKSSSTSYTFLDGSPNAGTWWYAIGPYQAYKKGIPGPNDTINMESMSLYVKVNDDLSNITKAVTGVVNSSNNYIVRDDITLKAVWIPNTYTITYDKNFLANDLYTNFINLSAYKFYTVSGSAATTEDTSAKYGKVVQLTMNAGTDGGPYLGGSRLTVGTTYTWSVYLKASREITLSRVGQEQGGRKSVKVTKDWQRITYTFTATDNTYNAFVFYSPSGGWQDGDILSVHSLELAETDSLNTSTVTKTYGNTLASLPAPTRSGYTFAGWYTAPTEGTKIATTTAVPASNTTYYAHWTVNKYTVTYDYKTNGGTSATKTSATVTYGNSIDLTPTAAKSDWTFVGWNTYSTATAKLTSLNMGAGNVTLYAIYSKTLTGTFNYYKYQTTKVSTTIYNTATSGTITAPATVGTPPTGYSFRHWARNNGFPNAPKDVDASGKTTISADTTFYASYSKKITITFDDNGAIAGEKVSPVEGTVYMDYVGGEMPFRLKMPEATYGYKMAHVDGWCTTKDGKGDSYKEGQTVSFYNDTTIYAKVIHHIYQNLSTEVWYENLGDALNEVESTTEQSYPIGILVAQSTTDKSSSINLPASKRVTLILNSNTITLSTPIVSNGSLLSIGTPWSSTALTATQKKGTIKQPGNNAAIRCVKGTVNIQGQTTVTSEGNAIEVESGALFQLNDTSAITGKNEGIYSKGGTISISRGTITSTTDNGIHVPAGYGGIVNVNGGTITGAVNGIWNGGSATINVNRGTVIGASYYGVSNYSGCTGTAHIGTNSGTPSTVNPEVRGKSGAVNNDSKSTMYFYSGRLLSASTSMYRGVLKLRSDGYSMTTGSATYASVKYNTMYYSGKSSTSGMPAPTALNVQSEDRKIKMKQVNINKNKEINSETKYEKEGLLQRYEDVYEYEDYNGNSSNQDKTLWIDQTENKLNAIIMNANWKDEYLEFNGETTYGTLDKLNTKALTIETTISCTKLPEEDDECIIGDAQNNTELLYVTKEGNIKAKLKIGEKEYEATSIQKLEENKVYGITLTYDGKKLVIYINGKEDVRIEIEEGKKFFDNELKLIIGAKSNEKTEIGTDTNEDDNTENDENAISNYFYGNMYTFSIYNEAIDEEKILNNYIYNSKLIEQE